MCILDKNNLPIKPTFIHQHSFNTARTCTVGRPFTGTASARTASSVPTRATVPSSAALTNATAAASTPRAGGEQQHSYAASVRALLERQSQHETQMDSGGAREVGGAPRSLLASLWAVPASYFTNSAIDVIL